MSTLFNITCGAHVFVFYVCTLFYITCGAHVFVFCERIRTNTFPLRLSEVCHELNIMFSITIGVGWLRINDRSRRLRTIRKNCTFARDVLYEAPCTALGLCCECIRSDSLLQCLHSRNEISVGVVYELFYSTCGAQVFVFCERIRMITLHLRLREVCHELNILFSITIGVGWLRLIHRSRRLRTNRMLYICTRRPLGSSMYSASVML